MDTLAEIYKRCGGDKGTVHSYIEIYEEVLAPYRSLPGKVLEIGVLYGQSLRMWEEYFTVATVVGVDTNLDPLGMADLRPLFAEGTHHIELLDASLPEEVEEHFKGWKFNVIVEDASHEGSQQLQMYENFKDKLSLGGIYIIEDIADIDLTRPLFEAIDPSRKVQIFDRRALRPRFDDVLVIIQDKQL